MMGSRKDMRSLCTVASGVPGGREGAWRGIDSVNTRYNYEEERKETGMKGRSGKIIYTIRDCCVQC